MTYPQLLVAFIRSGVASDYESTATLVTLATTWNSQSTSRSFTQLPWHSKWGAPEPRC